MTHDSQTRATPVEGGAVEDQVRGLRWATAAVLLVVAVAMGSSSLTLGLWTSLGPGAGFFPLCLAVAMAALAVAWVLRPPAPAPVDGPLADVDDGERPNNLRQILAILGSLAALGALLEVLGFQLSVLLFLLFHLKVLGRRRWLSTVVLSVVGSFGVFVLFTQVFLVPLPASSIPFLNALGL